MPRQKIFTSPDFGLLSSPDFLLLALALQTLEKTKSSSNPGLGWCGVVQGLAFGFFFFSIAPGLDGIGFGVASGLGGVRFSVALLESRHLVFDLLFQGFQGAFV